MVSNPLQAAYPDNFRVDYALSREQTNMKGGKMYIQDKMEEYADEIFGLLDQVCFSPGANHGVRVLGLVGIPRTLSFFGDL
jgi:hypothetical protein